MGDIQLTVVEHVVNQLCALFLYLLHGLHAAHTVEPVEHKPQHVNAPARRSVEHGVFFYKRIIAHYRGADIRLPPGKSFIDNNDREPGRCHILLRSGIDEPEAGDVHGP